MPGFVPRILHVILSRPADRICTMANGACDGGTSDRGDDVMSALVSFMFSPFCFAARAVEQTTISTRTKSHCSIMNE